MSLAFDENGRPFIILREQEKKKRVKGLEAHKVKPHHNYFLHLLLKFKFFERFAHSNRPFNPKQSVNPIASLDQYYGGTHCSQSLEDLTWTQRYG